MSCETKKTIKIYWYCSLHDDAFYEISKDGSYDYGKLYKSCISGELCDLEYIGQRIFENNIMIKDTTKNNDYFDRKGGGFKKEYLDKVDEIQ
jgi:hypothetical protein